MLWRYHNRLRQVDVKAEHFERQVQRLEQERDQWEKKYEVGLEFLPLFVIHLIIYVGCTRKIPTIEEGAR